MARKPFIVRYRFSMKPSPAFKIPRWKWIGSSVTGSRSECAPPIHPPAVSRWWAKAIKKHDKRGQQHRRRARASPCQHQFTFVLWITQLVTGMWTKTKLSLVVFIYVLGGRPFSFCDEFLYRHKRSATGYFCLLQRGFSPFCFERQRPHPTNGQRRKTKIKTADKRGLHSVDIFISWW